MEAFMNSYIFYHILAAEKSRLRKQGRAPTAKQHRAAVPIKSPELVQGYG